MGQDIKSYLDGQAIHELEEKMYALLQQGWVSFSPTNVVLTPVQYFSYMVSLV